MMEPAVAPLVQCAASMRVHAARIPIQSTLTGEPLVDLDASYWGRQLRGTVRFATAVANVANAQRYWRQVGCSLFGKRNTWYYTLYDAYVLDFTIGLTFLILTLISSNTAQTDLSFAVVNPDAGSGSKFPLKCPA